MRIGRPAGDGGGDVSRKTHAQHLKRLAEKRRRVGLVNRYFSGFIVSQRFYDYLVRHIDEIVALASPAQRDG